MWCKRGKWFGLFLLLLFLPFFLIPKPQLFEPYTFSQVLYDRHGKLMRMTLSHDDKYRGRVFLDQVPQHLVEAILLKEDHYFYWHPGVNPFALVRAFFATYVKGETRQGASTITMQVARLAFHLRTKSLGGKLKQILGALQLEWHYSKKEILEAYLTFAPYGGNIEGVMAAAQVYFGKRASELTLVEALTLAVIPQDPIHRVPQSNALTPTSALFAARAALFSQWLKKHPQVRSKQADLELPIRIQLREALPFLAPHFCDWLMQRHPLQLTFSTTLDLSLQQTLERIAKQTVEQKRIFGIQNASALLIDHRDMSVVAMLGSVDFFNAEIEGQVNGTLAKRSPGSALKPFIYALGFEQGVIHPMTMLKDSPMSFGEYSPENFDGNFMGPIKAKLALIHSRNLPAAYVANKLSQPRFYDFLQRAGISDLREESFYGLALVIGGIEVTMKELVELYAMLANRGVLKPLRVLEQEEVKSSLQLLSPEASFLALDILKDNPRPKQGYHKDWVAQHFPIYWKTGTSYAFRDAWSVGIFGPYVLAVWVGNFNGQGNPAFVGQEVAAPLMFQMIDAIRQQQKDLVDPVDLRGLNIKKVSVCSISGKLPSAFCPHQVMTWFIPGRSPIEVCDIHREVLVDAATGLTACTASFSTRKEVYEFWPSDLLKIFQLAGIPRRTPPAYQEQCSLVSRSSKGIPPQITSPKKRLIYHPHGGAENPEDVAFIAVADADVTRIHWFLNEGYLGSSHREEPFFWKPHPGRHVVRAVDNHGRSDAVTLTVGGYGR